MQQYDNTNLQREILVGEALSEREIEVINLAAKGLTSQETADELYLSVETVKGYKKRVIYKLDAKNTTHAVALCIGKGIVNISEIMGDEY